MKVFLLLVLLFSMGEILASDGVDPEMEYIKSYSFLMADELEERFISSMLEEGVSIDFGRKMLKEMAEEMARCQLHAINVSYDERYIGSVYATILLGESAVRAAEIAGELMEYDVKNGTVRVDRITESVGNAEKMLNECVEKLKSN